MVRAELPPILGEKKPPQQAQIVAEKPKPNLTAEDLFTNLDSRGLTEFGSKLQGIFYRTYSSMDPNMSPKRNLEIYEEIDESCKEIGVERKDLPLLREQMYSHFEEREEFIKAKFPLPEIDKRIRIATIK